MDFESMCWTSLGYAWGVWIPFLLHRVGSVEDPPRAKHTESGMHAYPLWNLTFSKIVRFRMYVCMRTPNFFVFGLGLTYLPGKARAQMFMCS